LIAEFEAQIIAALQYIFDQFGWLGLAGLMAFENATGLTPSEIPLALAGWMLLAAHDAPPVMVLVGGLYAALGSLTGSSITYWLVRLGGRPLLDRIARWVRMDPRHFQHSETLFKRWGPGLILFGRLVPGIRTLITIPAGLARMSFLQFLAFTFIGAYVWCTLIIGVGYVVGHEWHLISGLVGRFTPWAVAGFVALIGAGWMIRRVNQRRMRLQPVYLKTYENE
jgi:membrane protein DedA with SNARE-associated domain